MSTTEDNQTKWGTKTEPLNMRVTEDHKRKVKHMARSDRLTLTRFIEGLIDDEWERRGKPEPKRAEAC